MKTVENDQFIYDCAPGKHSVFVRVPKASPGTEFMRQIGADITRSIIEAQEAGFDVEVVRTPTPPWRMGHNQVHVRIWPKPNKG